MRLAKFIVGGLIALLAFVVIMRDRGADEEQAGPVSGLTQAGERTLDVQPFEEAAGHDITTSSAVALGPGSSAPVHRQGQAAALATISQLRSRLDPRAFDLRVELAAVCRPVVLGRAKLPRTSLAARIARYCEGYGDTVAEQDLAVAMDELAGGARQGGMERLRRLQAVEGDTAVASELDRLLQGTPSDVSLALTYGATNRVRLPVLDAALEADPMVDVSAVLEVASLLAECDDEFGCGADSLRTYSGCVGWGLCADGVTYPDQIRQLQTPRTYNAALSVLQRIRERRHP